MSLEADDRLNGCLRNMTCHVMEVNDKFEFLTKIARLMDSTKDEDIDRLTQTYVVCDHIRSYETQTGNTANSWKALDLLPWVVKRGHEPLFTNLLASLRTFRTAWPCEKS